MPRDSVLLTPMIDVGAAIQSASAAVWQRLEAAGDVPPEFTLRLLDGGVAVQLCVGEDVVLTVLRPRPVPSAQEVRRMLPQMTVPAAATSWTEAYTPWGQPGLLGVAVLETMARDAGGLAVHHDLAAGESARFSE